MGSVVEFLSMLSADESHSHVRRMLNICIEFERISKMALQKAERDSRGRSKRQKDEPAAPEKSIVEQQIEAQAGYRQPIPGKQRAGSFAESLQNTPSPGTGSDPGHLRPGAPSRQNRSTSSTTGNKASSQQNGSGKHMPAPLSPSLWLDVNANTPANGFYPHSTPTAAYNMQQQQQQQSGGSPMGTNDSMHQYSEADITAMTNGNAFNQPFVPQDLWQMPMTLEWDWSDAGMIGPDMNLGMGSSASVYDFNFMGMDGMGQGGNGGGHQ